MNNYCYESDWRQYAFPEQSCNFADEETLRQRYTPITLESGVPLKAAGMPVCSDGTNAVVNTENEMTIIYGATASKKTRTLIVPLICSLAQARESMIITDIKGELSNGINFPQVRGLLDENGYECIFLNFRDQNADGLNILLEPYRLYKAGRKDDAIVMVNNMVDSLAKIYQNTKADPFWEKTARLYLVSITVLLFEMCQDPAKINMLSLSGYTDWDGCENVRMVADLIHKQTNIMNMLRCVTSEPDKTRMSTLATVSSMFTDFLTVEKLLKMLSHSTFDVHDIYKKPTALFIIVPDEVDTYSGIVGLIMPQIISPLVNDAYRLGGTLPRRVNVICDEFCNIKMPGMSRAISAHRSRNIRWYLVCQSQKQLRACYPNDADTIIANCQNVYFLNTPEMELMEELSRKAGYRTITPDGSQKPILSVSDLQQLKKGWTHTDVYFTSGNIHYVASMPDISQYKFLSKYKTAEKIPIRDYPALPVYSPDTMYKEVKAMQSAYTRKLLGARLSSADSQLAHRYENLFE